MNIPEAPAATLTYLSAHDGMGNVHAMIKASDGSIATAYEYDASGKTLPESGPYAVANPFRYSTKYTNTDLVYHWMASRPKGRLH